MAKEVDADVVSKVAFVEPPEKVTRVKYDWLAIAKQLRSRPMEWALVFRHGRLTTANAVRQGSVRPVHPALGFEVRTTDTTRGAPRTCTMWLRWNPDKVDPVAQAAWTER